MDGQLDIWGDPPSDWECVYLGNDTTAAKSFDAPCEMCGRLVPRGAIRAKVRNRFIHHGTDRRGQGMGEWICVACLGGLGIKVFPQARVV